LALIKKPLHSTAELALCAETCGTAIEMKVIAMTGQTLLSQWIFLLGGAILIFSMRIAYLLFLHPLAKFPGPKLAAISRAYEFYYDAILRGQLPFQLQKLHNTYGEFRRISTRDQLQQDFQLNMALACRADH